MPINSVLLIAGVVLVLYSIIRSNLQEFENAIWFSGIGTILVVFSVFILAGFNNTCYYPSAFDLQSSLHIENSSSSHYTLTAMTYVSLFVPVVIAYIIYTWRAINNKKIDKAEVENHSDTHVY